MFYRICSVRVWLCTQVLLVICIYLKCAVVDITTCHLSVIYILLSGSWGELTSWTRTARYSTYSHNPAASQRMLARADDPTFENAYELDIGRALYQVREYVLWTLSLMRTPLAIFLHLSSTLASLFCITPTTQYHQSYCITHQPSFLSQSSSVPLVSMPPSVAPGSPLPPQHHLSWVDRKTGLSRNYEIGYT